MSSKQNPSTTRYDPKDNKIFIYDDLLYEESPLVSYNSQQKEENKGKYQYENEESTSSLDSDQLSD